MIRRRRIASVARAEDCAFFNEIDQQCDLSEGTHITQGREKFRHAPALLFDFPSSDARATTSMLSQVKRAFGRERQRREARKPHEGV